MRRMMHFAVIGVLAVSVESPTAAQFESVGSLTFDTSTRFSGGRSSTSFGVSPSCTVLAGSRRSSSFQAAQNIDPDFALAYWGETLCYNHPLFGAPDEDSPAFGAGSAWCHSTGAAGEGAHRPREGVHPSCRDALGGRGHLR